MSISPSLSRGRSAKVIAMSGSRRHDSDGMSREPVAFLGCCTLGCSEKVSGCSEKAFAFKRTPGSFKRAQLEPKRLRESLMGCLGTFLRSAPLALGLPGGAAQEGGVQNRSNRRKLKFWKKQSKVKPWHPPKTKAKSNFPMERLLLEGGPQTRLASKPEGVRKAWEAIVKT